MVADTLLVLTVSGQPPYTLRGLTESLEPQDRGQLRQDINGNLVNLTDADRDRRFAVRLSGGDMWPFPFGSIWRGTEITVSCTSQLGHLVTLTSGAASVAIDREPVTGSGVAIHNGATISTNVSFSQASSGAWSASVAFSDTSLTGAAHIYYRPKLVCLVNAWNHEWDEWGARPGWSLELLEKSVP